MSPVRPRRSAAPPLRCSPLLLLTLLFLWGPLLLMGAQVAARVGAHPALLLRALPLDPLRRSLFFNTLQLGVLTVSAALLLALPCAITLARGPRWLRGLVALGCALPLALPPIVPASLAVSLSFAPGADRPPLPPALLAAPVLAASLYPLAAFALAAALRTLPSGCEDAARLAGGEGSVWRGALLPLLRPALLGTAGLVFAFSLWELGAPDLLNLPTYAVQIQRDWNSGGDATGAVLDALPLVALGALGLWPALRALRGYEARNTGQASAPDAQRGRVEAVAGVLSLGVLALSPGVTLWLLARQITRWSALREAADFARDELFTTLWLAPLSALLIVAWAFALSARQRFSGGAGRWALLLPLLCPPITLGLALSEAWNFPLFSAGVGAPKLALQDAATWLGGPGTMTLVGYAARFLPPAVWLAGEAAARVPREDVEAAQSLGAPPGFAARTVLLPAMLPALCGAGAIVGALCVGELAVSVLVSQPGGAPLTLPLFNFMHVGEADLVAALSLTLFGIGAGLLGFFAGCGLLLRKLARR